MIHIVWSAFKVFSGYFALVAFSIIFSPLIAWKLSSARRAHFRLRVTLWRAGKTL